MDYFLKILGQLALFGGSAAVIAFGLLKFFGKKLLTYHFSEKLEEFKAEQSQKLQQLQYKIDSKFNRIAKIHEKEFEVLPKAWQKLQEVHLQLVAIAHPFQSWPDLNRYSENELENFLEGSELKDFQKDELRKASDKLKYYEEKAFWLRLYKARNKFNEFRKYLRFNKIFFRSDLYEFFSKIESIIIEAETELEHIKDPWKDTYETFKKLTGELEELMENLEKSIQERLHFDKA